MQGVTPIRIVIPAARLAQPKAASRPKVGGLSQQELVHLFESDLRPAGKARKLAEYVLTPAEDSQYQRMAALRMALYAAPPSSV